MPFANVIGHKNIIDFLGKSLKNGQIAHAYLFYGPAHLGKKTVAEQFAELLLKQPILNHPDVYFVTRQRDEKRDDLAKNINIEQMRELERKLLLSSFLNSYKIGIIEEAETLSTEAANSLLKTLEEPTPNTVIILLASNISALPATIISRCQVLKFLPVAKDQIYEHLISLGARRDEARDLASVSWGKPGLAIDLWQRKEESDRRSALEEYEERVRKIIHLMNAETLAERVSIFENFFVINGGSAEDLINELKQFLSLWTSVLRDAALLKNGCRELVFSSMFQEELKNLSNRFDLNVFSGLYRKIRLAVRYLDENFNPRLVLENLFLSF